MVTTDYGESSSKKLFSWKLTAIAEASPYKLDALPSANQQCQPQH